jgi:N-acetylglucosaminyl-diphospho-decaprenol L-rhamnosyltransferase
MHRALVPQPARAPTTSPAPISRPVQPSSRVPDLSVVIVNYRQWQDTLALVRQLRQSTALRDGAAEVVVIDNHSPADPAVPRLRRCPGVSLWRSRRNAGFAAGANQGCRLGLGRWLLLLNPDTSVPADFLDRAIALADSLAAQDPSAGVVGFALRHSDGSRQHSFGPFPTLLGSLARLLLPRARRKYHAVAPARRCRVPWLTGCCLLVRRDCYEQLGGFDEDFFLYYEDVDLCRRAAEQGWSVWYEPALKVTHHRPLHARTVPAHLRLFTRHASLTYARKHWPGWHARGLARLVGAVAGVRRRLAAWRGDPDAAEAFAALGAIAADLATDHPDTARRRLVRFVRRREAQLVR